MKKINYIFITMFCSVIMSPFVNAADIDIKDSKPDEFKYLKELFREQSTRDKIIGMLLASENSKKIITAIKMTGNKELIESINKYFEYYKNLYGNNEHGIPSIFPWKWFRAIKPIELKTSHSYGIKFLAISHNNKFIVASSDEKATLNKSINIFDSNTGKLTKTLISERHIYSAAISHDDQFIAICFVSGIVMIINIDTSELIHTLIGHTDWINSVAISHDDSFIVSASNDKTVIVWDLKTGNLIHTLIGHTNWITLLAISHDDSFIVTGSFAEVNIWNSKTGKLIHTLIGHDKAIRLVRISNDDSFIVTGSRDGTANIWDSKTGRLIHKLKGCGAPIDSIEISHDDTFILIGYTYGKVEMWDTNTGNLMKNKRGIAHNINSVAISHDDKFIVIPDGNQVSIFDNKTNKLINILKVNTDTIKSIVISYDYRFIVTGSEGGTVNIWHFSVIPN